MPPRQLQTLFSSSWYTYLNLRYIPNRKMQFSAAIYKAKKKKKDVERDISLSNVAHDCQTWIIAWMNNECVEKSRYLLAKLIYIWIVNWNSQLIYLSVAMVTEFNVTVHCKLLVTWQLTTFDSTWFSSFSLFFTICFPFQNKGHILCM